MDKLRVVVRLNIESSCATLLVSGALTTHSCDELFDVIERVAALVDTKITVDLRPLDSCQDLAVANLADWCAVDPAPSDVAVVPIRRGRFFAAPRVEIIPPRGLDQGPTEPEVMEAS